MSDPALDEEYLRDIQDHAVSGDDEQYARDMGMLPAQKKEFVPPQSDYPAPIGMVESAARGLMGGITMGFGDNIEAGIGALAGDNYTRKLAQVRARNRMAEAENPGASLAGKVAGSVASTAAIPGGAATKLGISGAASSLGESNDMVDPSNIGWAVATGLAGAGAGAAMTKGLGRAAESLVKYELAPDAASMVAKPTTLTNALSFGASNAALPAAGYTLGGPVGGIAAMGMRSPVYRATQSALTNVGQNAEVFTGGAAQQIASGIGTAADRTRQLAVEMAKRKIEAMGGGTPASAAHQKELETNPAYREAYMASQKDRP